MKVLYSPRARSCTKYGIQLDDGAVAHNLSRREVEAYLRGHGVSIEQARTLCAQAKIETLAYLPIRDRQTVKQIIADNCTISPGGRIPFSEFYERILPYLPSQWSRARVAKSLPAEHSSEAGTGNRKYVGNLQWAVAE